MKSRKLKYLQEDAVNVPECAWCGKEITGLCYWGYVEGDWECETAMFLCKDCKFLDWRNLDEKGRKAN